MNIKYMTRVHDIPYLDCNKKYMDETSCDFIKQIYKHIRDLKKGNIDNSLVKDNLETNVV